MGIGGYYVYMLRNVKANLLSWLYTLTSLSLALLIIITFCLALSLALQILLPELLTLVFPLLSLIAKSSFLEDYKLKMNPDNCGDPDIAGSAGAAGGPGIFLHKEGYVISPWYKYWLREKIFIEEI